MFVIFCTSHPFLLHLQHILLKQTVLRVIGCQHEEMQSPGDVSEKLLSLQKRKTGKVVHK